MKKFTRKSKMLINKILKVKKRTAKQIQNHYEIEKDLARRLKNASKEERKHLYSTLYDELYQRVPDHPQLKIKADNTEKRKAVEKQMSLLFRYLDKNSIFLELGPGDCQLSFEVAKYVKKVYAIDVSNTITMNPYLPKNFKLLISDGSSVEIPPNIIGIAYSNHLMEHLHPEDAIDQLKGIYNAIIPGGIYICITPHRFTGPHDISKYFDNVATGFHLKEYTNKELYQLFKFIGFSKIDIFIGANGIYVKIPINFIILIEKFIEKFSYNLRKIISKGLIFGFRIIIIATK